jgi:hypothetical protein
VTATNTSTPDADPEGLSHWCFLFVLLYTITASSAGEFADANEELLKTLPPPLVAAQYYLRCVAA